MDKRLLPLASMEHILKKNGAERVSDDAKAELKKVLEKVADKVSENALRFTKHANRNTIKKRDIEEAVKMMKLFSN